MKIAFILPKFFQSVPFGGFRVVYEIANVMARRGNDICLFYPPGGFFGIALVDKLLSPWRKYMAWRNSIGEQELRVRWMTLDERIKNLHLFSLDNPHCGSLDAIIATSWQTATLLAEQGAHLTAPRFYLIQGYETWMGPKERVDATWRLPFKKIVVSEWLRDRALELGDSESVKIPPGIDFKLFRVLRPIEERDRLSIGMVYNMHPMKGGKDALRALEIVRRTYPGIKVKFISLHPPGPFMPSWIEYHTRPPQELLAELYNGCAIFISASVLEGFGLPGAEALACGCALATTDSLGVREYAIDGETALVSPPRDPERLAENIVRLMDDDFRVGLAKRGNQSIKQFTWERAVDKFEEVIRASTAG